MLKTNSKAVREKVKAYILDNFDPLYYLEKKTASEAEIFAYIAEKFASDEYGNEWQRRQSGTIQDRFHFWAGGLPFDCFDYLYSCSAVELVGDWLEQTTEERNKYSEDQAEKLASYLIFKILYDFIIKAIYNY